MASTRYLPALVLLCLASCAGADRPDATTASRPTAFALNALATHTASCSEVDAYSGACVGN